MRTTTGVRLAMAFHLWAAMWAGLCAAQSELAAGQQYPAGTAVVARDGSVALTLPEEWSGTFREKGDQGALLLSSNLVSGVGFILFLRDHPMERLRALLAEPKVLDGNVVLELDGEVVGAAGPLSARYQGAQRVGRVSALPGPKDSAVLIFFAGAQENEAHYASQVQAVVASIRFAKAAAENPDSQVTAWTAKWQHVLAGVMLKNFDRQDGAGTRAPAGQVLHLCADHRFTYTGPSAKAESGRHSGRWQLTSADQDTVVLLLSSDAGAEMRLDISRQGDSYLIGNRRWTSLKSDGCR